MREKDTLYCLHVIAWHTPLKVRKTCINATHVTMIRHSVSDMCTLCTIEFGLIVGSDV